MQIQRIQTLWLILAVIIAAISFAFPWIKIEESFIGLCDNIPMLILGLVASILPLVSIFLFRNLKRQKTTTQLSGLFALVTFSYTVALSFLGPDKDAKMLILGPSLMVLSCIFDYLALKGINRDAKLLRDSDRLR